MAVTHLDQRADLEADRHRVIGARDLDFLAIGIEQLDLRTDDLGSAAALRIDHNKGRQAGDFVHLLGHGHALFHIPRTSRYPRIR